MSCNAKCSYCTFASQERGYKYKVLPLVQSLINKGILSKTAYVYMSGGETTISPEFEDLLSLLLSYLDSRIEIISSGIKYCKSIEDGFIMNKLNMLLSLDSGTRETYKKIKQVDCFDVVIENLKNYIKASDNVKNNVILKYIIVDDYNDNKEEIKSFIEIATSLGIKNVRLDIDYEKYKLTKNITVPDSYFDLIAYFNELSEKNALIVNHCEQVDAILRKS